MGHTPTPKQAQAAAAVRQIGTNAIPSLLRWLQYERQTPSWKYQLLRIASRLPDSTFSRYVRNKAQPTPFYEIQGRAFLGFALLGDQASSAIPALLHLADDPDSNRASRAFGAISLLGSAGAREIISILADPNSPKQERAVKVLASMRHAGTNVSPALPILVRYAHDPDPEWAWQAIYTLCNLGLEPELCFPAFTNALASTNTNLKVSTIHHLGYFGPPAVLRPLVPSLTNCLQDTNGYVRGKALEALAWIAPEVTLHWPDPYIRLKTIENSCERNFLWPPPQTATNLLSCLNDSDGQVRKAAADALRKIAPDALTNAPVR